MNNKDKISKYLDNKTILLGDESTYPTSLVNLLNKDNIIINYYNERKEHEKECKLNNYFPTNHIFQFKNKYNNLIYDVKNFLVKNNYKILAFHLTRITEKEKCNLLKNGLRRLDKNFFVSRIKNLNITNDAKEKLINSITLPYDVRTDIGSFHLLSKLNGRDYSGYCQYWGGEILSNKYKNDKTLLNELKDIGTKYLIIFKVSAFDIEDLDYFFQNFKIENKYNDITTYIDINNKIIDILEIKDIGDKLVIL